MRFRAYVDGGANNYKKGFGYGSFKIYFNDLVLISNHFELSKARTSNEAEFLSMIELLKYIKEKDEDSYWKIFADSNLVVKALNKKFHIHAENLVPLYREAINLFDSIKHIDLEWVSRKIIVKELGH